MYSALLENPRRRRRSRRRKSSGRRRRRARRSNPFFASNPPRRRRGSSRRRRGSRRRSSARRRRNPFGLPRLGGIGSTIGEGVMLHVAEFAGGIATRALQRIIPAGNFLAGSGRVQTILGVLGSLVLPKVGIPARFVRTFSAVQIAQGLYNMTAGLRMNLLRGMGLGDYVTVDGLGDDLKVPLADDYGLLDDGGEYDSDEPDEQGALNDYVTIPEYA